MRKALTPVRFVRSGQGGRQVSQVAGQVLDALQHYVLHNFEDVGSELARECLKVRYGLGEARNIRGVATEAEEEMLTKEGIELLKIPLPAKPEEDA